MSRLFEASPGEPAKRDMTATRNDDFSNGFVGWNNDGTPFDLAHTRFAKAEDND